MQVVDYVLPQLIDSQGMKVSCLSDKRYTPVTARHKLGNVGKDVIQENTDDGKKIEDFTFR